MSKRGRGFGGGGKSGGISWNKQKSEPKFIREFKERIAYKEQASVESKKVKLVDDLNIEKDEERPQVVQLKSGDLDEKAYLELKSKEDIDNAASSFGKILFKKPAKKGQNSTSNETTIETTNEINKDKKQSELDFIFNLDKNGAELSTKKENEEENLTTEKEKVQVKILLNDETQSDIKYGLQEPPVKKRYIDGPTTKVTTISASKILAREAKCGNKKLLSFYDEEEEKNSSDDE